MGPQVENGYTQIANLVLEDLAKACLTGPQYQLVFVVLRKTWGYVECDSDGNLLRDDDGRPVKRQWAHIGVQEFAEITGMAKSTVIRGLQVLVDMGVLLTRPAEGRRPAAYRYQKYADRWQTSGHRCNILENSAVVNLFSRQHTIGKELRQKIYQRDGYTCQYCGSTECLTVDHVIPKSKGGLTRDDNLVTACRKCNNHKAARTPQEAGLMLWKKTVL